MKITKESNGTVTVTGDGTILFKKRTNAVQIVGNPQVNIIGFTIYPIWDLRFISKIRACWSLFKWLSEKVSAIYEIRDKLAVNGKIAIIKQVEVNGYLCYYQDDNIAPTTYFLVPFEEAHAKDSTLAT